MIEVKKGYKMTELGEIPIDWEIADLDELADVIMGQSPSSSSYNEIREGLPFYQGKSEFGKRYPTPTKWCSEPTKIAEKDDILISVRAPVGEVNLCQEKSCIGRGLAAIRVKEKNHYLYIYYFLQIAKESLSRMGQGSTFTAINGNELRNLKIFKISNIEQQKIAEILSSVDTQIEQIEQLIEKTTELKKGLMQQLLTKGIGHTEFKQSELGEIPKKWVINLFFDNIENIFDYRGRTPKKLKMEWGNGNIPALSANNVKNGYIDFNAECYLGSEELYDRWMTKGDLKKGDVLFTMEAPLGNVTLVPDNRKYILSQRVVAFRTNNKLDSRFFMHYLRSEEFQDRLINYATGTTAKGISQKNLAKVLVVTPPIEEQKEIAEILSTVDTEIDSYEQEKAKYEELKKGLMQQLLTGKIRVKVDA